MSKPSALLFMALPSLGCFVSRAQQFPLTKLDSLRTALTTTHRTLGSLAISPEGKVVYSRAFGSAQLVQQMPATSTAHYRAGSLRKLFTAKLVLQPLEENNLTLSTLRATLFLALPNAQNILIDQLLSPHSGLYSFPCGPAYTQCGKVGH
jgi:D-alanyl-D-alanine carboxypeptidase